MKIVNWFLKHLHRFVMVLSLLLYPILSAIHAARTTNPRNRRNYLWISVLGFALTATYIVAIIAFRPLTEAFYIACMTVGYLIGYGYLLNDFCKTKMQQVSA